jgi:hypothetical protein
MSAPSLTKIIETNSSAKKPWSSLHPAAKFRLHRFIFTRFQKYASSSMRTPVLRLLVITAIFSLISCASKSSGPGGEISKVKYYHLVPNEPILVDDPAINFERQHLLYGAVTKAEVYQRAGHYYSVFWQVTDRTQPVKVFFEYRQANNPLVTKTFEQEVKDIRRSNISQFRVTGDSYLKEGRVNSWRVRVMRGKEELVSKQSFLWR